MKLTFELYVDCQDRQVCTSMPLVTDHLVQTLFSGHADTLNVANTHI